MQLKSVLKLALLMFLVSCVPHKKVKKNFDFDYCEYLNEELSKQCAPAPGFCSYQTHPDGDFEAPCTDDVAVIVEKFDGKECISDEFWEEYDFWYGVKYRSEPMENPFKGDKCWVWGVRYFSYTETKDTIINKRGFQCMSSDGKHCDRIYFVTLSKDMTLPKTVVNPGENLFMYYYDIERDSVRFENVSTSDKTMY